jgi:hypothetical protein
VKARIFYFKTRIMQSIKKVLKTAGKWGRFYKIAGIRIMKAFKFRIIKLSVFLGLVLFFGQTAVAQEDKCLLSESNFVTLKHILSKFRFTSRKTKSVEQLNKELIDEILERKVNFQLNAENEKSLKEAGASDLLIKTISENSQPEVETEAMRLYQLYVDNYKSDDAKSLKIALNAAKEFVKKFENDECFKETVEHLKEAILHM